ncbi:hypothetical protein KAR91_68400 [Candidatus Pacearchaeota archaeon]|nr:hypothetical protein [Candidatus Pacearchaeota archaeon]
MTIPFNDVSPSVRASKIFIELAGVKKSLGSLFIPPIGGLIGQYDPLKTSTIDYEPIRVLSSDDVGNKFGFGSHIHRQALRFPSSVFLQGGGVYAFPVPEAGAGAAATDDITFTGAATSAGTLYFLIGGELVQVAVANADAITAIGDALVTAITADQDLPVTATNLAGVVTVTAKFKGTAGNQILQVINPGGETQESQNPTGVTVALGNPDGFLSTGATDPSVEDVFFDSGGNDKLGDRWYTIFTMPFTDQPNIVFQSAAAVGRSDPAINRMFGSGGGYIKETYAAALALPAVTNGKFIGEIWENRYQAPAFELSAALVGTILDEQNQAPNRPYKTLEVDGPVNSDIANRRYDENDALFRAGMGYCTIDTAGVPRFGDIALTHRTNTSGGATEEWFDFVTLSARQAKAYSLEQLFLTDKYARGVVVDDAAVTAVSFSIAPKDVVSDITKLIEDLWAPQAWSKNTAEIIAGITAEINAGFEGRIDAELTDDEAKALRVIAVRYAYLF